MAEKNTYSIEVLDVALDVIEELADSGKETKRPSEIAQKLGMNRTRVYRILKSLSHRGYVDTDSSGQGYMLGLKFLEIGTKTREQIDLRLLARPILLKLAQTSGDVAHLLVRYRQEAICIDFFQGENRLQVAGILGQTFPLYIGASPKILLAYLPRDKQVAIVNNIKFKQYTQNTITDREQLFARLDRIRTQGFEVDEEDYEIGTIGVGAPVFDHSGEIVAGVTITTPSIRYNTGRRQELVDLVCAAATQISEKMGYIPPS